MANQFPFPLVPQFKKILKLVGDPSRTVAVWVNEKTKLMTPNPMKPHKKKKTKKLTLDGNKLQKTLVQIINKIDEIIDGLNKIPEIEKMLIIEIKLRIEEINRLDKKIIVTKKELLREILQTDQRRIRDRMTVKRELAEMEQFLLDEDLAEKIERGNEDNRLEELIKLTEIRILAEVRYNEEQRIIADNLITKTHTDYEDIDTKRGDKRYKEFTDHTVDYEDLLEIYGDHRHRQYTQSYPSFSGFSREPIDNRKYTYRPYTATKKITQKGFPEGQSMQKGGKAELIKSIMQKGGNIEIATTPQQKIHGLRGRTASQMPDEMHFPNSSGPFNTMEMQTPIDILKYDDSGRLIKSLKNVQPGIANIPMGNQLGTVVEKPSTKQEGGKARTAPVLTSREDFKQMLINDILELQKNT